MIAKQSEDELLAWPPCFETLAVVHQPYIPAPVKVGTATQGLKRSISAVPNPTTHEIYLGVADYSVDWNFRDAAGRLVISAHFNQGSEMTITVSSLSPGMYFGDAKTDSTQERAHYRTQFIKID